MGQRPTEIGNGKRPQEHLERTVYSTDEAGRPRGEAVGRASGDNPEAIRAEIEHSRAELSETIDAIQEKINPDVLKEQAKDALREATVGRATETVENAVASAEEAAYAASDVVMEVGESLMDTIKGNPIPSLLAGLGLGWLYMNRTPRRRTGGYLGRGQGRYEEYRYLGQRQQSGEGLADVTERAGEMAGRAQDRAEEMVGDARDVAQQAGTTVSGLIRENPIPSALVGLGLGWLAMNSGSTRREYQDKIDYPYYSGRRHGYTTGTPSGGVGERAASAMGGVMDQAQSTVGQVADQAQSTVGQVADQAQAAAGQMQETVGDIAYQTRRQAGRVEDKFQELLHVNPLAVGAAAIAVGALLGAAVPSTEREDELLGETRDNFMEQARGKAEEVAEKVQSVTESATDEAQRSAREEGLIKP